MRAAVLLAMAAAVDTYRMAPPPGAAGGRVLVHRPSPALARQGAGIAMRDGNLDTKVALDLGSWALGGAALGSLIGTSPVFAGVTIKFLPVLTGLIGGIWRATAMRLGELHIKWVGEDDEPVRVEVNPEVAELQSTAFRLHREAMEMSLEMDERAKLDDEFLRVPGKGRWMVEKGRWMVEKGMGRCDRC